MADVNGLTVMIVKDPLGTPEKYKLKTENISHVVSRTLISTPLPGGSVLQIDMDRTLETVVITGVCDEAQGGTDADGVAIADYADVQAFKGWYNQTIRLYEKYLLKLIERNLLDLFQMK